jgi:DNA-binding MarR family transcriptional regulator
VSAAVARVERDHDALAVHIPYLLNSAGGLHAIALSRSLRSAGVRYTAWRVLHTLWNRGPLELSEIALLANFELSTLSRVVDGLEEQGLVARLPPGGGRGVRRRIKLSAQGRRTIRRLLPLAERCEQQLLAGLSAGEVAQLRHLLGRLRTNMLDGAASERVA